MTHHYGLHGTARGPACSLSRKLGRTLAAVVGALGLAAGCQHATSPDLGPVCAQPTAAEAIVTFVWRSRPDTMHVLVRGAGTVQAACAYLAGRATANIPAGLIVRGAAPSDPALPFHYIPESVALADATIELCDSRLLKTEAEVDAYFQGVNSDPAPYCPWNAYPVAVS